MRILSLLFLVASLGFQLTAQLDTIKTIILRGQSNAVGTGQPDELPVAYQGAQSDISIFASWDQVSGSQPYNATVNSAQGNTFGVEASLSRAIADYYNEDVLIIKAAYGGTPLGQDPLRLDWHPDSGEYWDALTNTINAAQSEAASQNKYLEVVAAYYIEGEQDGKVLDHAIDFYANLIRIHEHVESLMSQEFPFHVVVASSRGIWGDTVARYQRMMSHVSGPAYENYDGSHYTGAAFIQMGLDLYNITSK